MIEYIRTPLISANEEEMLLVEWLKAEHDFVKKGEAIVVLETTKAVFELNANVAGYLTVFTKASGTVRAGDVIAAIAAEQGEVLQPPAVKPPGREDKACMAKPWTKKAEIVARSKGLNIEEIASFCSGKKLITESDVESYENSIRLRNISSDEVLNEAPKNKDAKRVMILGAGLGAYQILDVITRLPDMRAVAILDDNETLHGKKSIMGCKVIGKIAECERLKKENAFDALVVAVNNPTVKRREIFERCKNKGMVFVNVIDPSARVLSNVMIGEGNVLMPFCHIGVYTRIGDNNFLSAYSSIDHHNIMGGHSTFGPRVATASEVRIEDCVKFGAGIVVEPNVRIGREAFIASGVVLTRSIAARSVVKTRPNFVIRNTESTV